ncbi:hypothetical protein FHS50_000468 [Sphingomicrobium lutaoense]|uniref:Uncharacterized protein n=1 Tax=Sphingomicrobium lutaoense TaxID=515949 RepID=A0A839Z1I3_9SPHN|nr:hypothetical protein [Sphingomicrobium lutaoense]
MKDELRELVELVDHLLGSCLELVALIPSTLVLIFIMLLLFG